MKKIILALLVVMLAAGSAYAVDVKVVKGSYYVRGAYWSNWSLSTADAEDFMAYDHELELEVDFVVDETTKVRTLFEIVDEEPWDGYNSSPTGDDNIEFKRVYLEHKFGTGTVLSAGKMSAGTWAFAYMDNEGPGYRVKVIQFFPWGLVGGLVQKLGEMGYESVKDAEKDDGDAYALFAVFNAGPVSIMPLWFHIVRGDMLGDLDDDDLIIEYYALGLSGNFGMIGFEAEYGYVDVDWDQDAFVGAVDASVQGIYANVWANFEAFKVGALWMWNSVDDDAGLGMESGTDLDETMVMGEELEDNLPYAGFGIGLGAGHAGLNCYQIYADFAFGKFSFGGSLSFYTSNWEDDDFEATEYDLKAKYKITDNLAYDVGVGVASLDYDDLMGADPDDVVYAFHRIKVSF